MRPQLSCSHAGRNGGRKNSFTAGIPVVATVGGVVVVVVGINVAALRANMNTVDEAVKKSTTSIVAPVSVVAPVPA